MKKLIIAAALAGTFSVAHAGDAIQADSAAIKQGIEEGKMVHLSGEVVQVMEDELVWMRLKHAMSASQTHSNLQRAFNVL